MASGSNLWPPFGQATTRVDVSQRHLPCCRAATDRQKFWICHFHIGDKSKGDLWQWG